MPKWVLLFFLLHSWSVSAQTLSGEAYVIDGDTIRIHGRSVRLFGIDAPEREQTCTNASGNAYACGQEATRALREKIGNGAVSCQPNGMDDGGRIIAVCRSGGVNLNEWLVQNGFAVAYRFFSRDFVNAENTARQNRSGIWAGPFEMPYDFRKRRKAEKISQIETNSERANQPVKQSKKRICHSPGTNYYAQVKKFIPFPTLEDCLKNGGRLPRG